MRDDQATPFDLGPDPGLGAALRAALEPQDQAGFVARVVAEFDAARVPAWQVLAGWARRGIAAAAVAATLAALVTARRASGPRSLDEAFAAAVAAVAPSAPEVLGAPRPPDPGAVFAVMLER